jgi:hypothetical protein
MRLFLLIIWAVFLQGCFAAPFAGPAASGLGSIAGRGASAVSSRSDAALSAADAEMLDAQKRVLDEQARELETKRLETMSERAATVGILRDGASARHDPTLTQLAIWVDAGGDPVIAMNYYLSSDYGRNDRSAEVVNRDRSNEVAQNAR